MEIILRLDKMVVRDHLFNGHWLEKVRRNVKKVPWTYTSTRKAPTLWHTQCRHHSMAVTSTRRIYPDKFYERRGFLHGNHSIYQTWIFTFYTIRKHLVSAYRHMSGTCWLNEQFTREPLEFVGLVYCLYPAYARSWAALTSSRERLSQPPCPPPPLDHPWDSWTSCLEARSFLIVMMRARTRAILEMIRAFPANRKSRPMAMGMSIISFIPMAIIIIPMPLFFLPRTGT